MISPAFAQTMARYNAWQNQWMFQAADALPEAERLRDRGAFFGGIQQTLSHLMWGDTLWISRFDGGTGAPPAANARDTTGAYDWPALMAGRPLLDARISAWSHEVDPDLLNGMLTWNAALGNRTFSKPYALCVMQMFNHQTHHRGQVHTMLTACGVATPDTDLPYLPDEVPEWR